MSLPNGSEGYHLTNYYLDMHGGICYIKDVKGE